MAEEQTKDDHVLRTDRLALRPPDPSAASDVFALVGDPRAVEHNPSDLVVNLDQAEQLLRYWISHWDTHAFGYWCVHRIDEPTTLIGVCGVKVASLGSAQVLNLLYRLVPQAWGQGFATEAATVVLSWAQQHEPDRLVIARVRPANVASQRVAIKAGMHRTPWLDEIGEDGPDLVFTAG